MATFVHENIDCMAGIYLHIPFCKRRCLYCDFYSTTDGRLKDAYIRALCRELADRKDYLHGEPVETLYFGGGTPSQLLPEDFRKLFDTLYQLYDIDPNAEITLEANPDDLTEAYIGQLADLPFNRLSIGIQTFDEGLLQTLNRRHTAAQAVTAFHHCRQAGFGNISIDLMYGLPDETEEQWQHDLETATALRPEHISAYHLIYEEGTPLWQLREAHRVTEANEELSLAMFTRLMRHLRQNGYEHYEISNFCLPGCHSRHNSSYWTGQHYLGCGPSAHSYDGNTRRWNVSSLSEYLTSVQQGRPFHETETLDLPTRYNDFIITSLRTCWGLSLQQLRCRFGTRLYDYCLKMAAPHIARGHLTKKDEDVLVLTEQGIFISDGIMSDLLWVE